MTDNADTVAARIRLAKASDAWLEAEETGALTQTIVDEYYAAHTDLMRLIDGEDNA